MLLSRKPLRVQCSRQVFQTPTARHHVSMRDVEDMIIATRNIESVEDKKDLFDAHGMDYDRVAKYYMSVKRLNKLVEVDKPHPIVVGGKAIHFRLTCFWRLLKAFLSMLFDPL